MKNYWIIVLLIIGIFTVYEMKSEQKKMMQGLLEDYSNNNLPSIINFGSECPHCMELIPVLNKIKAEYKNIINVHYVNIDNNEELVDKFKVITVPTLIFLDKEGNELARYTEHYDKEFIEEKIDELGLK